MFERKCLHNYIYISYLLLHNYSSVNDMTWNIACTVNLLHTNLQVVNFQRCECAFHQHQMLVTLQLVLCLLLLKMWSSSSTLSHLLSFLQSVILLSCSLSASCCIILLYISKYYTYKIKNVSFIFCVSFLYLYEKYYKPITVQYYMAGCVSWIPRFASEKKNIQRMTFSSVQFSCSVVSDSLWPHESQHARPPCPSPTPRVHSDSRPSSQWCHPAISSSIIPFSSCP